MWTKEVGIKEENIRLLLDEDATRFKIKNAITNWLFKHADRDSIVIEMMVSILEKKFWLPVNNITVLRDEEATREGILAAFKALTDHIADNEVAIIHYSGYGSWMRDREGYEPDGWDETIVPYDSGRGSYSPTVIFQTMRYIYGCCNLQKRHHT